MNTKINYQYWDGANYKVSNVCIIRGEMTEEQKERIVACLEEEEYFIPSLVGMPERKFDTETEDDHPWFEWCGIEQTDTKPTLDITAEELAARFEEAVYGWQKMQERPDDGLAPYCVTIQETLQRTVIVWAADRLDAEETAQNLCNDGVINLDDNDFTDRQCTCDGVATLENLGSMAEYRKGGQNE